MVEKSKTDYWAFEMRYPTVKDIGHTCRECKKPFQSYNEKIALRRGGRIELRYHEQCFSGDADPRTQGNSSYNNGKFAGTQQIVAPKQRYNKMRTNNHF